MKKILSVVAVAVFAVVVVACVPSPTELCKTSVTTFCKRTFECQDAGTLGLMASFVGTSATDCQTKLEASSKCADKKSQDEFCTQTLSDGGTLTVGTGKFDLTKASSCNDKTLAESCGAFLDATQAPADCAHTCGQ